MQKAIRSVLGLFCLMLLGLNSPAFAQPEVRETRSEECNGERWGWYGTVGFGGLFTVSQDISPNQGSVESSFFDGYAGSLSVGYDRAINHCGGGAWEVEYTYRSGEIDSIGTISADDEVRSHSVMLNYIRAISLVDHSDPANLDSSFETNQTRLKRSPRGYFGGGVGISSVGFNSNGLQIDDSSLAPAGQVFAGIAVPLFKSKIDAGIELKYFIAGDVSLQSTLSTPTEFEFGYQDLSLMAKIRFYGR